MASLDSFTPRPALTVYSASAGSGKTFTLTAEYIARLLSTEAPAHRHILAVTFTKKATGEMKERILQELWGIAQMPAGGAPGDFAQAVLARLPGVSAATLRQRAAWALRGLLHDYDYFHVRTIDSFFQSLLTNLAHELNLSASFRVSLDDAFTVETAVDHIFARVADHPKVLAWIVEYINTRIDDDERWDARREIKELGLQLLSEAFLLRQDALSPLLSDEDFMSRYRGRLVALRNDSREALAAAAQAFAAMIAAQAGGYEGIKNGKGHLQPFIDKLARGEVSAEPSASVQKWARGEQSWFTKAALKAGANEALAAGWTAALARLLQQRTAALVAVNSCSAVLRYYSALRLFAEIADEVRRLLDEQGAVLLRNTPVLFHQLIGGSDAPFVFERAGTELRHVMIDEFQDTSLLQWMNFRTLLLEHMSQGHDCLLVGDVKQSIYRWRGGNWEILQGVHRELPSEQVARRTLQRNFRSARAVVAFNNRLFPRAAQCLDEACGTAVYSQTYADVVQTDCGRAGGRVQLCFYDRLSERKRREVTAAGAVPPRDALTDCCATIVRLHRDEGVAYGRMAVLLRGNREAGPVLDALAALGIPTQTDESLLLTRSYAVQLVIGALRYLCDAGAAASCCFVAAGFTCLVHKRPVPLYRIAAAPSDYLPAALVSERAALRRLPLYELVRRVIALLELARCPDQSAYLFSLCDYVLEFLAHEPSDPERFLTYWDEQLSAKASAFTKAPDGVRVMTIHKAKGLAFDVVLMPRLEWGMTTVGKGQLWCEPAEPPYSDLPLVPVRIDKTLVDSVFAADHARELQMQRMDNLNLLYVAFTRARQQLYAWCGIAPAGEKKTEASDPYATVVQLVKACVEQELTPRDDCQLYTYTDAQCPPAAAEPPSEATAQAAAATAAQTAPPPCPLTAIPREVHQGWEEHAVRAAFRQSNEAAAYFAPEEGESDAAAAAAQRRAYLNRGTLLHRLFSALDTAADLPRAVTDLVDEGVITTRGEAQQLEALVRRRLQGEKTAPWFDGSWTLRRECAILSRDAAGHPQQRRPDRVMQRGEEMVVVDYKFGRSHTPQGEPIAAHWQQVREYCTLLSQMHGAGSRVRGYLWYVYTDEVVEVA